MKVVRTFGRSAQTAEELIQSLEQRGAVSTASVEPVVRKILAAVEKRGERAVLEYATKLDGLAKNQPLLVAREEMRAAWESTDPKLQEAMRIAQANIRAFAEAQKASEWTIDRDGVKTGQIVRPLASVGCYVPGGRYPLPSTLLMTVTPAQVAGVKRIVVSCPRPSPALLAAAEILGVGEMARMGGAQAIGAFAYGTESIPRVDKICGPGNRYVTAAKRIAANDCAIDMPAGPTEVLILATGGNPNFIAADLLAQAEHDPDSVALLVTTSARLARETADEVTRQLGGLPKTCQR